MRHPFLILAGVGLLVLGSVWFTARTSAAYHARRLEALQQAWAAEKAELEVALERARGKSAHSTVPVYVAPEPSVGRQRLSPEEIIYRLSALSGLPSGPDRLRSAVYWLEELVQAGPSALPAIRDFFLRNEEVEFDTAWFQGRAARDGKLPSDQVAPVSLRLALIEVATRIGGDKAETLLAEILASTVRGVEAASLNRSLQLLVPGKYKSVAVTVARTLLASGAQPNSASPLDRYHREYLFSILSSYGDTGYANDAQAQLVHADSQIDRGALRYLQQTLGPQAVPVVEQAYRNPVLSTNSFAKEPLARVALQFVGGDASANEFWSRAINDPVLTKDHRRNLIEDLNQDGFADTRNLTAADLPLVQARITLIEQLAPSALDQVNAAAFAEAYKDLINMRAKITGQPPPGRP